MPTNKDVLQQVERYRLTVGDFKVFPPYVNNNETFMVLEPFKQGKGTPAEMQTEAARRIRGRERLLAPWMARRLLFEEPCIGVDCSGFAANILNELSLREGGPGIYPYVTASSETILQAVKTKPDWVAQYAKLSVEDRLHIQTTPILDVIWVADKFGKTSISQTNVARLASDSASVPVGDLAEVQPADLIVMRGKFANHVLVVSDTNGNTKGSEILAWDSGLTNGDIDRLGGVGSHEIIVEFGKPLEEQTWSKPGIIQGRKLEVRRPVPFAS
jgi:hypothetical protein